MGKNYNNYNDYRNYTIMKAVYKAKYPSVFYRFLHAVFGWEPSSLNQKKIMAFFTAYLTRKGIALDRDTLNVLNNNSVFAWPMPQYIRKYFKKQKDTSEEKFAEKARKAAAKQNKFLFFSSSPRKQQVVEKPSQNSQYKSFSL